MKCFITLRPAAAVLDKGEINVDFFKRRTAIPVKAPFFQYSMIIIAYLWYPIIQKTEIVLDVTSLENNTVFNMDSL